MILTEKEAKLKMCHTSGPEEDISCVASDCMAWRWAADTSTCRTCDGTGIILGVGGVNSLCRCQENSQTGYCGMAGKPLGVSK